MNQSKKIQKKERKTHSYIKHFIKVWRLLLDVCLSHLEREYLRNIKVNFVYFQKKVVATEKLKKLDIQSDKKALISVVNVFIRKFTVKNK